MLKVKFKMNKKLIELWQDTRDFLWRKEFLYGVFVAGIISFLVIQLSLIPSGASQVEVDYVKSTSSIQSIAENPLYLPHKLATYTATQISDSIRVVRAISIVFFGLCVIALYRILKRWHSEKIAFLSSLMFATSAFVLTTARLASPEVMLFGWAILISLLLWLLHGESRKIAPLALVVFATGILYVPGAPYFFLLLTVLFSNKIVSTFKNLKRLTFYLSLLIALIIVSPLIYAVYLDINILRSWLLLPETIVLSDIPKNILQVPSTFFYKSPEYPLLNVGTLPILDVASGGLFLIGLYAYQKFIKLERTKIMILTAFLGLILGALGQYLIAVLILLPFTFSVIGAGISYMLDIWYSVFPKNPFAKSFGLLLITIVVLMSVYYQLTRFLVVWVNAPETRATYNQSRIVE